MDLVIGTNANSVAVSRLIEELNAIPLTSATLYVGYPILSTADMSLSLDAILTSIEHGIVVFDLTTGRLLNGEHNAEVWSAAEDRQTEIELALKSRLIKHKELTVKRELVTPVRIVTYLPIKPTKAFPTENMILTVEGDLKKALSELAGIDPKYIRPLNASIQQVINIKPQKKRTSVTRSDSKGGILRVIEREIANLDRWQKKAAIECPEGPQRIRGLAGSGKTVVLALKAAYLHSQHPEWDILVTFQTRTLYTQFQDLIRRFTYEHIGDEPNWDKLRVLHAWGSMRDPGVYYLMSKANSLIVRDYSYAKNKYGAAGAFEGVCREAVSEIVSREGKTVKGLFDAVLVDEAQDFGPAFFRLLYASTRSPKRFIWAYDELQSLKETAVPNLKDLFGSTTDGEAIVKLRNQDSQPQQDIILPICYRNTPWALTTAHALGFGVYRKGGLIQMFDDTSLWSDIGYKLIDGSLTAGATATLKRRTDATPDFFRELLKPEDAVILQIFADHTKQAKWVADQIKENLVKDELEPSDILVIFSDPVTAAADAGPLVAQLLAKGIQSHIVGVTRGLNEFHVPNSIAISGIYRAKGNEAAVVYVLNSEFCYGGWGGSIRRRSILFTAITRSRAWVRICGVGENMQLLANEWSQVVDHDYCLSFNYPTPEEIEKMRRIHRDRTEDELQKIDTGLKSASQLVELFEREEINIEDIPEELRDKLLRILATK